MKMIVWRGNWRLFSLTRQVAARARPKPELPAVAVFNASSRLAGLSQNAAFTFLAACGLQLAGAPLVYFVCNRGMSRCVQGTDRDNPANPPPCAACTAFSQKLFAHAPAIQFGYERDETVAMALEKLGVDELSRFEYPFSPFLPIPLGSLVLPSLRWSLRLHHLADDEATRFLFREVILSAWNVAKEFNAFLERVQPATVVVFNGIMFPEGTARWVARQRGIRVVTHEVGFQPFSAFFTDEQATAYPIHIPEDFELDEGQNERLNAYLEQRFRGKFTMAGIRFWPEMRGLDEAFLQKIANFRQVVPVFTNVIYDTSQIHANVVFPHMFAWLDLILEVIRAHSDTLFVIRAHPDEMRPGTRKISRESVQSWVERKKVTELPNVVFVNSQEYLSSYELIRRAKFVMVYNSSIGVEATLLGAAVLCGGKARFTQYPTVFCPNTAGDYRQQAEVFLKIEPPIEIPTEFQRNARRFLYYQLYRASLPFGDFLETGTHAGFVQLRSFSGQRLTPQYSSTLRVLVDGILRGAPFLLPEK